MDKKELKKKYNFYINNIKKYNRSYFNNNKSLVTDEEYDELKNKILNLEKKYDFLSSKNSPSKSIGYKPSKNFKKFSHKVPMLSLSNVFSEEDLINFEKKISNYLFSEGFK